ncbi:hypothetical protein IVA79_05905 [Bradyrhizobium sp. 138]|uniref:hypothetical protein n=1 Tax=Bradyrhizobium sp. 138 TaxID=2782615 RepID=UPI001FFA8E92|nr:hypothetical protein [Bradyrhizobium sp. 138]MCK1733504.1 hypothetical protein [Bradyrhizobium sp. 138]
MAMSPAEWTEQLASERRQLSKADRDIEQGLQRISDQEDRIRELSAGGHDSRQAKRLVDVLRQTLTEWQRHRVLIEQRIAYLEQQVDLEWR